MAEPPAPIGVAQPRRFQGVSLNNLAVGGIENTGLKKNFSIHQHRVLHVATMVIFRPLRALLPAFLTSLCV